MRPLSSGKLGWLMGLEPTTSGITIRRSNQLNYSHHGTARTSVLSGGAFTPWAPPRQVKGWAFRMG